MKDLKELYNADTMREMYRLIQVAENNIRPLMSMYEAWKEEHKQELLKPLCVYRTTTINAYAELVDAWNALVYAERILMYEDREHWNEFCEYFADRYDRQREQLYAIMEAAGVFQGMKRFEMYKYLKEE